MRLCNRYEVTNHITNTHFNRILHNKTVIIIGMMIPKIPVFRHIPVSFLIPPPVASRREIQCQMRIFLWILNDVI